MPVIRLSTLRRLLRWSIIATLLAFIALKTVVDSSWVQSIDRRISWLTAVALIAELAIVYLLVKHRDVPAGIVLFLFGLGIVLLAPILRTCNCLGPFHISQDARTALGLAFGAIGASIFLFPQVIHMTTTERRSKS